MFFFGWNDIFIILYHFLTNIYQFSHISDKTSQIMQLILPFFFRAWTPGTWSPSRRCARTTSGGGGWWEGEAWRRRTTETPRGRIRRMWRRRSNRQRGEEIKEKNSFSQGFLKRQNLFWCFTVTWIVCLSLERKAVIVAFKTYCAFIKASNGYPLS